MRSFIIIPIVCILSMQTIFGQYFSRSYFPDALTGSSFGRMLVDAEDGLFLQTSKLCSDTAICSSHVFLDHKYAVEMDQENLQKGHNLLTSQIRNDTIFYGLLDETFPDSMCRWIFGMKKTDGTLIAEYYYDIIHLRHVLVGQVYQYPGCYGVTLSGNKEIILWGEGNDNRIPRPEGSWYQSCFLRVRLDGTKLSDLIWFEKFPQGERRMVDVVTDQGNSVVFNYSYGELGVGDSRSIVKFKSDNSFEELFKIRVLDQSEDFPKIAIDHDGNYILNTTYQEVPVIVGMREWVWINKVDRQGNLLWRTPVPVIEEDLWNSIWTHDFKAGRIKILSNNDILVTGSTHLCDSFFIPSLGHKDKRCIFIPFICRMDQNGKVLWRHLIAHMKEDEQILSIGIRDAVEQSDGSLIFCGSVERLDGTGYGDAWIMRVNSKGCFDDDCSHVGKYWRFPDGISSIHEDVVDNKLPIIIYPNPGQNEIQVQVPDDVQYPIQYQVATMSNQVLEIGVMLDIDNRSINTTHLTSGMYLISIRDKNGQIRHSKWIKQ
jgi:hypothetical protein